MDFNLIQKVKHPDINKINYESNFVIPGNHLYMVMNKSKYDFFSSSDVFFSTIKPNLDYFDGRHSSLLLSNYLYEELVENLKKDLN